jgi:prevent-host-death family protein
MYTEIGSFDAKAHFSRLLREVQQGQCFTITLRGHPVADLIPNGQAACSNPRAAIEAMQNIDKISNVTDAEIKSWIDEGRR